MNHRSNFDYLLVAYLASRQTTLSYAAGEWAKVFVLQSIIRAMGAFFVRRDSGNPLYRCVLERYVHMATREGVCQAVFPEGGLTKTGALAPPKLGFIDYMLRGFDVDKDRDVIFLPVGINYDKVVEDQVQINAGHGIRVNRSIWNLTKTAAKFLSANFTKRRDRRRDLFGYASVNFGYPISTKDFADRLGINFVALDKETRFNYTAMLAQKLMNGIGYVTPVLPVPLIAQVFRRSGAAFMSELDVISAVHELIDELIELGAPLNDSEKPARKTVEKSLALMAHYGLLQPVAGGYQVVAEKQDLIDYYANSIEHWFGGVDHIDPLCHRIDASTSTVA
jgi:glycerol-3-phosphate O-acyltransferase